MFQYNSEQLEFDNGVFPSIIINPEHDSTLAKSITWLKSNTNKIESELALSGAVLFRNFPLRSAEDFDVFSTEFNYPSFTYAESLSNAVRINYTERVFTANEAPKDVEIYLHHEMAQTPISPEKIFFYCQVAAQTGGATPICRSDMLFEALLRELPEYAKQFEEKGVRYTTYMPAADDANSGQGRSWKSTLSVETKQEAEQKLDKLGYSWSWIENDQLQAITPALPAVIEHHDDKVFYNQLLAAYLGWQGVKENPDRALSFGDGSSIAAEVLDKIASLAKQFTYDLNWQNGDMVLIDNRRTMHGRRPYSGELKRVVLVALAA